MAGTANIGKQEREPASEEKGLFSLLKNFFLSKGEVKNRYDKGRMRREFGAAQDALNSVLYKWDSYDKQVDKDVQLRKEKKVKKVKWHYFKSATTGRIGASKPLLKYLKDRKIPYEIHTK